MHSSLIPVSPRQVTIGDAASFVGTTPQEIRRYHELGLLPEPERSSDDDRRYGHDEVIRLLWIHKMADAGIAVDDIRDVFADPAPAGAGTDHDVAGIPERPETTPDTEEAERQRQRTAVQSMRTPDGRMSLLSEFVSSRLTSLPEGSLRQADLDNLLVIERILGPLAAAVNATRYIALATHADLREESDRVDAAEEALDDAIAVDDPRVAQVAAQRHAVELAMHAVMEESGLAQGDDAIFDSWDALHPDAADDGEDEAGPSSDREQESMSAVEAIGKMPYDFSPARLRCMELALEIATHEPPAS